MGHRHVMIYRRTHNPLFRGLLPTVLLLEPEKRRSDRSNSLHKIFRTGFVNLLCIAPFPCSASLPVFTAVLLIHFWDTGS